MKLTHNTILITGGTSGIGLELVKSLLSGDNKVILLGKDRNKLNDAEKNGFYAIQCDLSNPADIENAVVYIQNKFPDLNILFNNAGIQYNYLFADTVSPQDTIRQEIEINVTGQIILTQRLIPVLAAQKKALIVNTTSGLGAFPKIDGLVYSAGKAAMRSFTTGLRLALKQTPVRVLEFIPPVTDTGMTAKRNEKKMSPKKLVETILPQIERERRIATVPAIRLFLWISFLFPKLAHKILSK